MTSLHSTYCYIFLCRWNRITDALCRSTVCPACLSLYGILGYILDASLIIRYASPRAMIICSALPVAICSATPKNSSNRLQTLRRSSTCSLPQRSVHFDLAVPIKWRLPITTGCTTGCMNVYIIQHSCTIRLCNPVG
jgi:hypothetical protein